MVQGRMEYSMKQTLMKKTKHNAAKISLALFVVMGGVWAPTSVMTNNVAHAAVQKANEISQEDAMKIVQSLIVIPKGAKIDNFRYEVAHPEWGQKTATWNLSWRNSDDQGISVTLDASSGRLLSYFSWSRNDQAPGNKELTQEAAEKVAQAFLKKAAKDEAGKLSKANEYPTNGYYGATEIGRQMLHYTRVENGIPFLENGFTITVDANLNVTSFNRNWTDDPLPDATAKLSKEDAEKKLIESLRPSLLYRNMGDMLPGVRTGAPSYALVYQYGPNDPSVIDANSGDAITASGRAVAKENPIQPLGNTVRSQQVQSKLIGQEEAQKIAERWIKQFPGEFRSEGSHGGGTSIGPDGTVSRNWSFSFAPINSTQSGKEEGIDLNISDRGELVGYEDRSKQQIRFRGRTEKVDSPISWKEAKEKAVQFVKRVYPDRLGELYVESEEPSAETLHNLLEEKHENYQISFKWLVGGVPVDNSSLDVEIDPKDGEVIAMSNFRYEDAAAMNVEAVTPKLDAKQAVEVEFKEKKIMLTYFQPGFDYRYGRALTEQPKPILVYQLVGGNGVVDAATGKWIDFDELRKQKEPQDIANHPKKAALLLAVSNDILQVQDGKLEPEKPVTKAEFISALIKASNRIEFNHRMWYGDDEQPISIHFQDVSEKHPYYGAIQQAVRYELLDQTVGNFEPDKPITRVQAAKYVDRFLGMELLLTNQEIFKVPFTDVAPADVPAVALAYSFGLFPVKDKHQFQPDESVSRADLAVMYQQLQEKFGRR